MSGQLLLADARALPLAAKSVDCVVTSPPYWAQRDYGFPDQIGMEDTPAAYIANLVTVCAEVQRVLRDDGTFWLVIADTIFGDSPIRKSATETFSTTWDTTQTRSRGGTRRSAAMCDGVKAKSFVGIPYLLVRALQLQGWRLRNEVIWAKPNARPEGRTTDRLIRSHESIFMFVKSRHYRFYLDRLAADFRSDVWTLPVSRYPGAHYATFPDALVRHCLTAATDPGHVVLDPFMGSGTTCVVAESMQRRWVGIDRQSHDLAQARLALPLLDLAQ